MPRPLQAFIELARRQPGAALWKARAERHAGSRCHLLAWAAHCADPEQALAIAHESLAACEANENPFEGVALAAWPLSALAERGLVAECERALPALFARAKRIENPVCRLDALERVLQALVAVDGARGRVLQELIAACGQARSWKAPRCLWRVAALLAKADPAAAALAVAALPPGPHRRRGQRELAAGGGPSPRFFI